MPDFLLPDLGEGLTEAEIVTWLVRVGDEVVVDQAIVEVETAKAVVEVPVPYAGLVTAVFGQPGESLAVGSPLISIGDRLNGADESAGVEGLHEVDVVMPDPPFEPAVEEGSGNVLIGYGTGVPSPRRRRTRPTVVAVQANSTSIAPAAGLRVGLVISPLVRKLARDSGIDLSTLTPTGAAGTIRRCDVEQAIAGKQTPVPSAPMMPSPAVAETPGSRRIPITGLRRLIADKMSTSRREIPEATVWVDVDATDLLTARALINRRHRERPVSILALLSRFAVLGLRTHSELHAHIDGNEIVIPSAVHLGLAAQTERGLVVPVIRNAQDLSTRDLSAAIGARASAARAGKLAPQEMSGGTFTINNYGVFGVDGSAAIINHPEVAILGLGRIIDRPWVVDGEVVARKVAQLSLAFDHRVCDGGVAGGFLRFVADCVEEPVGVLGDL